MIVGVDIDGVCYPWTRAANEAVMERFGVPDPGEHQHWDYLKERITDDQWGWIWSDEGAEPVFGRTDMVFPQVVEIVNRISKEHEVHFVTHRNPRKTSEITGRWLKTHFRRFDGLHVLDNVINKSEVMDWDLFIDDKDKVCENLLERSRARVFMPNRPWNDHYVAKASERWRFTKFDDWEEVAGWLKMRQ